MTRVDVNKQEQKIAKIEEPLKMQESLVQTANLAQTKIMAVATGDENKYSTIAEVKNLLNSQMLSMYPVGSIYMSTSSTNPSSLFGGTWVAWGSGRVPVGINTGDGNFNTVEKTGGAATHLHSTGNATLTLAQLPAHSHSIPALSGSTSINGSHNHTSNHNQCANIGGGVGYTIAIMNDYGGMQTANVITSPSGDHSHTVTTNASTTGNAGSGQAHNHGNTGSTSSLQPYITCYMWKRTA